MSNIAVLDQNTINKIAAGEVIERPASVVKELLENAIDAGASAVTVEIRDGGTTFIRVTDNGHGIPAEEIGLAFLRHSTSKIRSVEDLFTIASLGFRGEALSSIAAVAQVEVISKTSHALTGIRYQIEGGVEKSTEEIGAPEGTTFLVRNLFYNTPARKEFLKTPVTEGSHVSDLVEKIALSHPDISVRLIQNNQNKLHTSGNHNLKDLIYTVFGRDIAANLLPVNVEKDGMQICGFIGKPVIARGNRNYENYYINGRFIKSQVVSKAIEEAYKPYMMQHKYPFTLLHLNINPETLDVNVHPTKMELRFRDGEQVFLQIKNALIDALAQKELIPKITLEAEQKEKTTGRADAKKLFPLLEPFEKKRFESDRKLLYDAVPAFVPDLLRETSFGFDRSDNRDKTVETAENKIAEKIHEPDPDKKHVPVPETAKQLDLFDEKLLDAKARKRHKLLGQLFDTYWLVEYDQSLYIIDQHAAHEKVLFERTMEEIKNREPISQSVNPPIILTFSAREEVLWTKNKEYFIGVGFEIEPFGGKEYAVRGVPANLLSIAKRELLMTMLDDLSDDITSHSPDIIYEKVASASCKAAVKGNQALSAMEANQLIDQLLELENPYACPHGRPTIISMSKYELEKKFKRIL